MTRLLALVGLALVVSALLPNTGAAHDHRRRYYAPSYPYYDYPPPPPRYCYPEAPWGHRYWDAHHWECHRGRWYYRGRPWH